METTAKGAFYDCSALERLFEGIVNGLSEVVERKVNEALDSGIDPTAILNEGMMPAMSEVGQQFEEGAWILSN